MSILEIDNIAKKSYYNDIKAYNNVKAYYADRSDSTNTDDLTVKKVRNSIGNVTSLNKENKIKGVAEHARKIFETQSLSRRQRRKLSREQRLSYKIQSLSSEKGKKREAKKLDNMVNANISLPWVDGTLWAHITSSLRNPLPSRKPEIGKNEVRIKDSECCSNYLSPVRSIRSCWFSCFTVAACHAACDLRLYSFGKRNRSSVLSVAQAVENTSKSTHSGAPLMTKKNDPKNIAWVKKMLRDIFRKPSYGKVCNMFTRGLVITEKGLYQSLFELPQMLFRRYQIDASIPDLAIKTRVVWCIPHLVVALEAIFFYKPLQELIEFSKSNARYVYSIGLSNRQISESLSCLRKDCIEVVLNNLLSLDYRKYDQTIPIWFFDIFFSIMQYRLKLTSNEKKVYDALRLYIKYTPMIVNGKLVFKTRGISSGLFITNLLDTLFNLTLIKLTEIFFAEFPVYFKKVIFSKKMVLNEKINSREVLGSSYEYSYFARVLGDDGLVYWCQSKLVFLKQLCFHLGMEVNVKQVTNDIKKGSIFYLGRYWDEDNVPDQSFLYMAAHIIFRTKFYNKDKVDFDISNIDAMRILSVCLPLKSGRKFIKEFLSDYPPLVKFLESDEPFVYLKEYPNDGYIKFKKENIPTDPLDF